MIKNTCQTTAIALLTTALLTACASSPMTHNQAATVVTDSTNHATTVTLALGQNTFIKQQQLNLTFDKVINDSRCASGAQCIWAGNATVAITVMSTTSRPQTLNLSLGDLRGELRQTQRFANFAITLDSLTPVPASNPSPSAANLPTIQLTIKQLPSV